MRRAGLYTAVVGAPLLIDAPTRVALGQALEELSHLVNDTAGLLAAAGLSA